MEDLVEKSRNGKVLFQEKKPFVDQRCYHLFDQNKLDYLIFDTSDHGEIDADKYTLYNLTADKRVENALLESRFDMMDSWVKDMTSKKHCLYARESLNGSKAILKVRDPFNFLWGFFYSKSEFNTLKYKESKIDQWIDEAIQENNPQKRQSLYRKIVSKILDDTPAIFLFHIIPSLAYNTKKIRILITNPYGTVQFNKIELN